MTHAVRSGGASAGSYASWPLSATPSDSGSAGSARTGSARSHSRGTDDDEPEWLQSAAADVGVGRSRARLGGSSASVASSVVDGSSTARAQRRRRSAAAASAGLSAASSSGRKRRVRGADTAEPPAFVAVAGHPGAIQASAGAASAGEASACLARQLVYVAVDDASPASAPAVPRTTSPDFTRASPASPLSAREWLRAWFPETAAAALLASEASPANNEAGAGAPTSSQHHEGVLTPAPRAAVALDAAALATGPRAVDVPTTPLGACPRMAATGHAATGQVTTASVGSRAEPLGLGHVAATPPMTAAAAPMRVVSAPTSLFDCAWQNRAVIFTKATLAKHAWTDRRRALEAVKRHARAAASRATHSRTVASHRRRQRLSALAAARERWSRAVAQDASDLEHAAKRRRVAEAAAARSGFVGRELRRAWRRWRAKLLVEDARTIRLLAATAAASKGRKRRGLAAWRQCDPRQEAPADDR